MRLVTFGHTIPHFRCNPLRTVPQEYLRVEDVGALGVWQFPGRQEKKVSCVIISVSQGHSEAGGHASQGQVHEVPSEPQVETTNHSHHKVLPPR